MRIETYRDLTQDELLQKREEIRREIFNLRLKRGVRELENPLKLRMLRRDIAKIETILSEDRTGIRKIVDQVGILDQNRAASEKENK